MISVWFFLSTSWWLDALNNNWENYPRKCFWKKEIEIWVKFNPGLSANWPSNNWAQHKFKVIFLLTFQAERDSPVISAILVAHNTRIQTTVIQCDIVNCKIGNMAMSVSICSDCVLWIRVNYGEFSMVNVQSRVIVRVPFNPVKLGWVQTSSKCFLHAFKTCCSNVNGDCNIYKVLVGDLRSMWWFWTFTG